MQVIELLNLSLLRIRESATRRKEAMSPELTSETEATGRRNPQLPSSLQGEPQGLLYWCGWRQTTSEAPSGCGGGGEKSSCRALGCESVPVGIVREQVELEAGG